MRSTAAMAMSLVVARWETSPPDSVSRDVYAGECVTWHVTVVVWWILCETGNVVAFFEGDRDYYSCHKGLWYILLRPCNSVGMMFRPWEAASACGCTRWEPVISRYDHLPRRGYWWIVDDRVAINLVYDPVMALPTTSRRQSIAEKVSSPRHLWW